MMVRLGILLLAAMLAMALPAPPAAAQGVEERLEGRLEEVLGRLDALRARLGSRNGGIVALMGYNMTPDGSTNALQVNRATASGGDLGSSVLTLGQFGAGFTVAESFPLWLEGYLGYARYDPRAVFTGIEARRTPLRWNNVAATIGIGYDIRLAEYLWLRPIFNASLGYAASDLSLFGRFLDWRFGAELDVLKDRQAFVAGLGGSLMLAYYDYQPERDIDVELRYTHLELHTFGDTLRAARGRATAQTIGLWARYRWPTGWEAFGRPVRWVLDGSASWYVGDQAAVLGFDWSVKLGGGIEVDVGRYEIGAVGIYLSRLRLVARYFYGDGGITGASVGIGMSF